MTGVFKWKRTTATQLKDGSFRVNGNGFIENEGGTPVTPTGDIRVTIGGDVRNSTGELLKLSLKDRKHTFKFLATALATSGLPAAGHGAPTKHELGIMFEVPVAGGTNVFETIIELKRPHNNSKRWKR